ncbi:MAG: hypothetical protein EHM20_01580 [Alphaproteobacteria bacterium]|nr:MAG: hypothetical protein EHM20_01580 [Alphaproteobacteria bacterium]
MTQILLANITTIIGDGLLDKNFIKILFLSQGQLLPPCPLVILFKDFVDANQVDTIWLNKKGRLLLPSSLQYFG